jgi:hypothetical protein
MTLAAHILLDTGAIVFGRALSAPGGMLIAMGDSRALPRCIFACAVVDGPRTSVPGYDPAAPQPERMAAIDRFLQALAGQDTDYTDRPSAEGPPAACDRPRSTGSTRQVFDPAPAAAGREAAGRDPEFQP